MTATSPDALAQATSPPSGAAAQSDTRADLEKQKLQREIAKLEKELSTSSFWLQLATLLSPLVVVGISGYAGYTINKRLNDLKAAEDRRQQTAETTANQFSALIEDRARSYAKAYENLSPTALYFPRFDSEPNTSDSSCDALEVPESRPVPSRSATVKPPQSRSNESLQLSKEDCARMGSELSHWYFSAGGLLMTEASRDAYFTLMEALRRAVTAPGELAVQTVGQHAQHISLTLMTAYRQTLGKRKYPVFEKLETNRPVKPADVEQWQFGRIDTNSNSDALRFKDFVLIQTLASRFRTSLTDDIGSRKPPASSSAERYHEKTVED